MKKHWKYLSYVVRHKWFVLVASRKVGTSLWRALVHDLSKFRPSEWFPYVESFYGKEKQPYSEFSPALKYQFDCWRISKEYAEQQFNLAWLKHQHRNPHHWQHWLLREDSPGKKRYTICDYGDWEGGTHIHDSKHPLSDAHIPTMDLNAGRPEVDRMMRSLVCHANANAGIIAIRMPRKYALEMVADWMGAGRAISGRWECAEWYSKNKNKMILHKDTRRLVEEVLNV